MIIERTLTLEATRVRVRNRLNSLLENRPVPSESYGPDKVKAG